VNSSASRYLLTGEGPLLRTTARHGTESEVRGPNRSRLLRLPCPRRITSAVGPCLFSEGAAASHCGIRSPPRASFRCPPGPFGRRAHMLHRGCPWNPLRARGCLGLVVTVRRHGLGVLIERVAVRSTTGDAEGSPLARPATSPTAAVLSFHRNLVPGLRLYPALAASWPTGRHNPKVSDSGTTKQRAPCYHPTADLIDR